MLKQIKFFQEVVKEGSFSRAAEKCFISQSAISQHIKSLENELGVKLLDRHNRTFSLTPAGDHFYRKSSLLLKDFNEIIKETKKIAQGDNFSIKVGCIRNYCGPELQKALVEFNLKYPKIPIEVKYANHEELYEDLMNDNIDLVLSDQRRAFSDYYINII